MADQKKKVLIIDDEKPILKMYSALLSDYEVFTATNGEEGLKAAKSKHPDLIYLDIIMPKMNGLDVLKKLKENKETEEIPVVLLTNLPAAAAQDKAKSLGAYEYFVKVQYEPEKLLEETKKILG